MKRLKEPPPGKCILGTFMSSNHFVTHQTHKNGQYYNLKLSKSLFKCKRDSRMNQKFQFYLNFQMTSKFFYRYCGGHYNIKIRHFELMEPRPPPCQVGLSSSFNSWQEKHLEELMKI